MTHSPTRPGFEVMSKRRKGYPSETNVKRGLRTVRGGEKELVEKLGRRDPCPCGSGKRFAKCCMTSGRFRWRGAGGLLAVRSANISICVGDHIAAELDEISVGEVVFGIVRAPGTNDEVVGAVFKQNVIDGGERGEAGLVDRAIGARLFVRIGADLLPREFFPGVKVATVRGADGVMDQAAIIGAGDDVAFAPSIAPNMRGGFAMKPSNVLNLANAAIQKFGNSEFAQCNRAVVSGCRRRCATLPVRFWNCHGGSARIVPNRRPRAVRIRSRCAARGVSGENIIGF